MFVTSDGYDIPAMARFHNRITPTVWRECLIDGIGYRGVKWPGFHLAVQFLVQAAEKLGLKDLIQYGGYNLPGEWRTRPLSPRTIIKIAKVKDEKREAEANAALFQGDIKADTAPYNFMMVGGEVTGLEDRIPCRYSGHFIYPFRDVDRAQTARFLLRLAAELLNADYAFYFIRDNWLGPEAYNAGMPSGNLVPLNGSQHIGGDFNEINDWVRLHGDAYWDDPTPRLRDVYEFNLLSERHLKRQFGTVTLGAWIYSSSDHGILEAIGGDRYIWSLSTAQMQLVRPQLVVADAIFARYKRVYRSDN